MHGGVPRGWPAVRFALPRCPLPDCATGGSPPPPPHSLPPPNHLDPQAGRTKRTALEAGAGGAECCKCELRCHRSLDPPKPLPLCKPGPPARFAVKSGAVNSGSAGGGGGGAEGWGMFHRRCSSHTGVLHKGQAGMHWKGRDLRGGQAGGWRGLPKRLGAVTVGYKCH